MYIVVSFDELTKDCKVEFKSDNLELVNNCLTQKLHGAELSRKESWKCARCPLYKCGLSEADAVAETVKYCDKLNFNAESFECENIDEGIEATKLYYLLEV